MDLHTGNSLQANSVHVQLQEIFTYRRNTRQQEWWEPRVGQSTHCHRQMVLQSTASNRLP